MTNKNVHYKNDFDCSRETRAKATCFGQLNNTLETDIQAEKCFQLYVNMPRFITAELFNQIKDQFEDTYAYSSIKASTLSINSNLDLQDLLPVNHIHFTKML